MYSFIRVQSKEYFNSYDGTGLLFTALGNHWGGGERGGGLRGTQYRVGGAEVCSPKHPLLL